MLVSSAEPRVQYVAGKDIAFLSVHLYESAMLKKIFIAAVSLFTSSLFVFSAIDTPETRRHEAERYLQVNPPKALLADMAENLPPRSTRAI